MKNILAAFIVTASLLLAACSTPSGGPVTTQVARPNSPGLPFGDMRFSGSADQRPTLVFMPSPFDLRAEFEKKKISGEAIIGFTVSKDGKPEGIKIVSSNNSELARLAGSYVAKMVFRPARAGGTAVVCDVEMPFFQK